MPLNINISFFPAFYVGPKSVHMISSALICKTQTYIETVCLMLKESNPSNLIWTFCAKLSLPSVHLELTVIKSRYGFLEVIMVSSMT